MAPGNAGSAGQTGPRDGISGAPIRGVTNGSVVFSLDGLGVLRKLEMDRVKRNEKRTERREQGQEGVSEDEPDELAPFLMVAPSGGKAGPPSTGAASFVAPENSNDLRSSTTLLFDDTVAEKNSFKANDNSIPDATYSLARNGISPPLTLFLPTSLDRVRSGNAKTVKHGTGETTKVNVIDVSAFPDEETLSQATFVTCYNTFLTFVEGCAGARIFPILPHPVLPRCAEAAISAVRVDGNNKLIFLRGNL
ncbi:hypothetical protein C8R46DRAFT_1210440 [Mycena filopes]|nr:hypothetical protein C8R46DRAFT_1210440 [Mycena filopes]